ncbi:hypothetical protein SAMN05444358_103129 [Ruegeria halocynthiae]|uniref:Uncharacterized protein n=1 Tax=Ruegeria halocynthiae TaxID=985054 RepID=A0A1H2Z9Y5_9RHOB|nr:hypothetical protein SAMN05444358_103129 [Ruegeria halocynthiae]
MLHRGVFALELSVKKCPIPRNIITKGEASGFPSVPLSFCSLYPRFA